MRQQELIRQQQSTLRGSGREGTVLAAVRKERAPRDKSRQPHTRDRHNKEVKTTESCSWCGKSPKHDRQHCPAREAVCRKCKKKGHYQAVCRSTAQVSVVQETTVSDAFLGAVTNSNEDCWTVTLQLNSKPLQFCIDTGADVTAIPEQVWKEIGKPSLQPSDRNLKCPDTHSLSVKGMMTAQLKSQSNQTEGPIYIVRGLTKSLLGRPAIKQLQLISRINAVSEQELFIAVWNSSTRFHSFQTSSQAWEYCSKSTTSSSNQGSKTSRSQSNAISTPRRVAGVPLSFRLSKKNSSGWNSLGVIKKVEEPTDWCAGMVVVPNCQKMANFSYLR